MQLQFEYLADYPDSVPQVIAWWRSVWGDRMGPDLEKAAAQLRSSLGKVELPIHVLAMLDGKAVGVAALKLQELGDVFPDKQYWLGSVFVDKTFRDDKIASAMTLYTVEIGRASGTGLASPLVTYSPLSTAKTRWATVPLSPRSTTSTAC